MAFAGFSFFVAFSLILFKGNGFPVQRAAPTVPPSQNQSIIGRPFNASDIMIGPFVKVATNVPAESCFSTTVQYTKLISTGLGTYRVPHSRIYMNGKKCGKLGPEATEDQLWVDSHMELIPLEFLDNETIAIQKGANAAYTKLYDNRRYARAFLDFSRGEKKIKPGTTQTWLGFERFKDRVCGEVETGQIQMPQNALIFFGKNDYVRVNLTNLLPRLTSGGVVLEKFDPYHLTFTKAGGDEPEHLCPQVFADQTKSEERGEVRKCFPGDATVQVRSGARVRMRDLRVGDRVRDGSGGFSAVYLFSHRDATAREEFVTVYTDANVSVTLSETHYVRTPGGLETGGALRKGSVVATTAGVARVTRVERSVETGLYNPHTMSGDIVVDGVVASVYTSAVQPVVAHALLAPFRMMFWTVGAWRYGRVGLERMFETGFGDRAAALVPRGRELVAAGMVSSGVRL